MASQTTITDGSCCPYQWHPTHHFSCFLVPKEICRKLDSIFLAFLWSGISSKRGIHWRHKQIVSLPKRMGGLGVRSMEAFNKALLAKQASQIATTPQSLLATTYRDRYRKSPLMYAVHNTMPHSGSYGFRGICQSAKAVTQG